MSSANSYSKQSRAVQVNYCTGEITGLREVTSLGTIVQVHAGPWSERDVLKKTAPFYAYALTTTAAARVYFGSGNRDRAIGDRLSNEERAQVEQVYVVHSRVPSFDRALAGRIEHRLIADALEIRMPVNNRQLPFGSDGLSHDAVFNELMIDVHLMLAAAGFIQFDRWDGRTKRSSISPSSSRIDAVRYIEPEDWIIPADGQQVRLDGKWDLQVEAYRVGKNRVWVAPGADWCRTSKSGLSSHNRKRRNAIESEGMLEPHAVHRDRARLRLGLDCTAAIAAKLLTGDQVDSDAWQSMPGATPGGHPED